MFHIKHYLFIVIFSIQDLLAFKLGQPVVDNTERDSQQLQVDSDANPEIKIYQGPEGRLYQSGKRQAFFFPGPMLVPGFLNPVASTSSSFGSMPLSGNPNPMSPNNQFGNILPGSNLQSGGLYNPMIPNQQSGLIHSGPYQHPPTLLNQGIHLTNDNGVQTNTNATALSISTSTTSTTVTTTLTPQITTVDSCAIAATICHLKCPSGYLIDHDDCTVCVCTRDILAG